MKMELETIKPGIKTELKAIKDSRKSFGGKANVVLDYGVITLWSYNTEVAEYNPVTKELKAFGLYSTTTLRQIKEFIYQMTGESGLSQKEIIQKYMN